MNKRATVKDSLTEYDPDDVAFHKDTVVNWYCIDRHDMATLCASQKDALDTAVEADQVYPRNT